MTPMETERFEAFLSDSFREGTMYRELRLSKEELEYTKRKYPKAHVKEMVSSRCIDGKAWFIVEIVK